MKTIILFLALLSAQIAAQTGALIPGGATAPDERKLSVEELNIDLLADNQHLRVRIVQIFRNRTADQLDAKFVFALPDSASVSDFAVWDGINRIPGVMLEKRRAEKIYAEIKEAATDPGILMTDDDGEGAKAFSARVFPIPANGTKRIELEYRQPLPISDSMSRIWFPLRPSSGKPAKIGALNLKITVTTEIPLTDVAWDAAAFPLAVTTRGDCCFEAAFHASDFITENDFSLDYTVKSDNGFLSFITHRMPEVFSVFDLRDPPIEAAAGDGFFELRGMMPRSAESPRSPRTVLVAVDTSLSMHGERIRRAVEAAEYILGGLTEQDFFNLAAFNDGFVAFNSELVPANERNKTRALEFLRNSELGGGSDIRSTLTKSREMLRRDSPGAKHFVILTDGEPTRSTDGNSQFRELLAQNEVWPKIHALVIGNRNGSPLLDEAVKLTGGFIARMRETEDSSFHTTALAANLGQGLMRNMRFIGDASLFRGVYQVGDQSGFGSSFAFVGRYRPGATTSVRLGTDGTDSPLLFEKTVELPEFESNHAHLPALWARARIDVLLRMIDREGESRESIEEIIALSQKFRIVTPYTAFLAAPRALLRPRVIQPGDPVIRVRTDEAAIRVTAVLPHGEVLPLLFVATEKVWQTRFLAPEWMKDGEYKCRLLIELDNGDGFEESRAFTIDGKPPTIIIDPELRVIRAGGTFLLKVRADRDTSRLRATLGSGTPVALVWSEREKACVALIPVPNSLGGGRQFLRIRAEDFARNESAAETELVVIGN